MFERSRRKFVAAVMAILTFLFLGTLTVIYVTSYIEMSNTNFEMLEHHAEIYTLSEHLDDSHLADLPPDTIEPAPGALPGRIPFENDPSFQLSTFYTVAISETGDILATDMGDREVYEANALEAYATDIVKESKNRGTKGSLIYYVAQKNGYTLVAFMDNTVINQSMTTLFRYTLIFGSVVLVALFFLAVYMARRIVKPLEESYKKQKQFISDAGHELKTPISVIAANAELIRQEIGDNQWLSNICYENERMGNLVTQLLELARTENVKPKMERLDLSRLVAGGVLPFEGMAYEKGLVLNASIAENITVFGNYDQLSQLISILVDNAIHHGQAGKEVSVSLSARKGSAVLSVINDGTPIPGEKIPRLFERFYRVDEARTSEDNHYGLGLAIAKAVVTVHDGKIDVVCRDGTVELVVSIPLGK